MEAPFSFGAWLRRRRKALDLMQAELAHQLGCATVTLQKIEQDERRPSTELAQRLADLLAVPLDERAAFLQIARGERAVDGLTISDVPPDDAVPWRVRPPTKHTLPASPASLIGREREVADAVGLLRQPDVRLVTLTGPGGVGKTRLALAAAEQLAAHFADGALWLDLAPISDPALVATTVAAALDISDTGGQPIVEMLKMCLRPKRLLLVLDNVEHVVSAAPLLPALLSAAPGLKMLVTSRAVLNVSGEYDLQIPPLAVPARAAPPGVPLAPDQLATVAAVRLFVERAQAARADFRLDETNAPAVAAICKRLDGLPLALELAAVRLRLIAPHALLARLEHRLHVLTGGARDLAARQQTLRNTLDWSYRLLSREEQTVFARLAVFVGGWTVDAAEDVCQSSRDRAPAVLDGLQALIDNSLLRQVTGLDGEPRCTMLETIREYALERLEESGEREDVCRRHARYFLALAEAAAAALQGPEQRRWLVRLDAEHDNLRAVLAWSTRTSDASPGLGLAAGLRLAGALHAFWERYGHVTEGRAWLDTLLAQAERAAAAGSAPPADLIANATTAAARLAFKHDDLPAARHRYDQSLAWHTTRNDARGRAFALVGLGNVARGYNDLVEARTYYQEALTLRRTLDDTGGVAGVLFLLAQVAKGLSELDEAAVLIAEAMVLDHVAGDTEGLALDREMAGQLAFLRGNMDAAITETEAALALYRDLGERINIAEALDTLGWLAVQRGEYPRAASLLTEAVTLARELDGTVAVLAWPLCRLGIVALRQGDAVTARRLLAESLVLFRTTEPLVTAGMSLCLLGMAGVAGAQQPCEHMARLAGAAAVLHKGGDAWDRGFAQHEVTRTLATARAALGEEAFAAGWTQGRAMTLEQAIAYAEAASADDATKHG